MNSFYHEIKLPGVTIPGNLFLAPIAGFSDAPFRKICTALGASLCFTEMVSCDGLIRNGEKTMALMHRSDNESNFAVQVFTANAEIAHQSMPEVVKFKPDIVDLNCGCPVPKVVKNGAGSALMKDPKNLEAIVKAMNRGIREAGSEACVSVKIRSGWDSSSINYREVAAAAVEAGAAMISLHSRTRVQGYSGEADWEHLRLLKEAVNVPVIGSGDLFTPESALAMFEQTGCDGVMFSRGALGNPWIFERTKKLLLNGTVPDVPSDKQRTDLAFEHLKSAVEVHGESKACKEMKKHLCSYTKGTEGAAELRNKIVHAASFEEYKTIFESLPK